MFKKHWDKRRKEHSDEPKYISLCYILEGSGEDLNFITSTFDMYMLIDLDYDQPERNEMINYLLTISQDK